LPILDGAEEDEAPDESAEAPLVLSFDFDFAALGGEALVVSFWPVALICPARLDLVLPEPSLVFASGALLAPDCVEEDDAPDDLSAAELPVLSSLDVEAPGFEALVVSFWPVALIWPARFDLVLPEPSLVFASGALLMLDCPAADDAPLVELPLAASEPAAGRAVTLLSPVEDWACAEDAPNIIASAATPNIRFRICGFVISVLLVLNGWDYESRP
jgi:hypothetical protein